MAKVERDVIVAVAVELKDWLLYGSIRGVSFLDDCETLYSGKGKVLLLFLCPIHYL